MSNTLHKLKEAVHPTPQEYTEPAGIHHHSAAAPRTTHAPPGAVGGTGAAPPATYSSSTNYTTAEAPYRGHEAGVGAAVLPGPAPNTAGPHRRDILNKLDPTVDSKGRGQTVPGGLARAPEPVPGLPGPATTTAGPHRSNLFNKLDPKVDSRTGVMKQTGASAAPVSGTHGHMGAAGATAHSSVPEGTYGPHKSHMANALDPRVDSDLDRGRGGAYGSAAPAAHHATDHVSAGTRLPGPAPNTAGPHHSDILNKLDPTVNSRTGEVRGSGTTAMPATEQYPSQNGAHTGHPVHGSHHSRMANDVDPRVDPNLDRHHAGTRGWTNAPPAAMSGAAAPGPAPNTAGPHRSDLLNKIDPTVDSKPHASARYY